MRMDGKVALITGASEGIGAACAAAFLRRGAKLALAARSEGKLREAGGAESLVLAGDLMDSSARRDAVERTLAHFGRIDILVNNAGVGTYAPARQAPMEQARRLFELNYFAALEMTQLAAEAMRKQGSGTIVNIGSIAGKITLPWCTLYSSSKFALGSLTDGLRIELRRDGIHVMSVCPGYVRTAFQEHVLEGGPPQAMRRSRRFAITAERCAEDVARGIERNARTVVTPRAGWLFVGLERLFPRLVDAQLERMLYGTQ
jgi:short-subunit dehydrogenase